MNRFGKKLCNRLKDLGYQVRTTSLDHLHLLEKQISEQRKHGLLDNQFFQDRLAWFRFQIPESLPGARSLIIVAVPIPQKRAIFAWNGKRHPLIIAPTYSARTYRRTNKRIENLLAEILSEEGYRSAETALPLKLLAVRSGLGQYGRNNLCYVPGMGSLLQLVAVYSDMPCEEDSWKEATMMEKCEECELCRQACPTGAIPTDRFLLRGERCISYHNEMKGDVPFPRWIDVSWHNCLEGCMLCQRACPLNKHYLGWVEAEEEFSEEETALLLEGTSYDKLPEETRRKMAHLEIQDDLDILPRNMSVFFKKRE